MTQRDQSRSRENARKWTAALRSGEFKQGRGHLRDPLVEGYCCLGVACEVYRRETGDGEWRDSHSFAATCANGEVKIDSISLPQPVQEWLGLATSNGDRGCGVPLTDMNDDGAPFAEIAGLIEVEPGGLFA